MSRRAIGMEDREAAEITFDAAFESYVATGSQEELLRAAGLVINSTVPIDEVRGGWIGGMAGSSKRLETYGDAAHAVRHYFALLKQGGTEY